MISFSKKGICGEVLDTSSSTLSDQSEESVCVQHKVTLKTLQSFVEGDHTAFDVVFQAYYLKIRNFLLVFTKSKDIAEELAQDIFVNLWEKREQVDPAKNFTAYLYTIAKNSAILYLKKNKLRQTLDIQTSDFSGKINNEDPILNKEVMMFVDMAISQMPKQRRKIYELRNIHNKNNDEIACEMDITKKCVEKHLRLAVADIKGILKKHF